MKKVITIAAASALLVGAILTAQCSAAAVYPAEPSGEGTPMSFEAQKALYAHALTGGETEAWTAWQCAHDDDLIDVDVNTKYFFLPSSASETSAAVYNASGETVTIAGTTIPSGQTQTVNYELGKTYDVDFSGQTLHVSFLRSSAEAAVFVNNTNADGSGRELMSFLSDKKSNSASATGAVVDINGNIDNTPIKKIKGRGNTTWDKSKKPFNITYENKISIAGMAASKKYSMLANYQDDSLSRNRFLYDLSDAVGMPYASDSRYVDFYVDGYYWGSYQMAEKIEAGSSNVVNDLKETDYLGEDGKVKEDFPFVCEIDPSAGSDDYTINCSGVKVTIKVPELEPGDTGYEEVKDYVKSKFSAFLYACANPKNRDLTKYGDIDSLTKLYLINELGKNWDSGVASTFFTYKKDSDGTYKFYGSPVWDYDNSLGNCVGIDGDLRNMGVKDYEEYTGWWCMYKGKSSRASTSSNVMNNLARNPYITEAAPRIWFEEFVPAMRHFSGEAFDDEIGKELYTSEKYYALICGSAEMNYKSGWLLNTGAWIASHDSLNKASFDYNTGEYAAPATKKLYPQTFEGMYNYCVDWFESRAAWLSSQMYDDYNSSKISGIKGDADGDGSITSADALLILRSSLSLDTLSDNAAALADVNGDTAVDSVDALAVLRQTVGLGDPELGIGEAV